MTTFSVWKYDNPGRAEQVEKILRDAEQEGLVELHDTAVVTWPVGASRPTTRHHHQDTARGAGWGAMWGFLFGVLFFVPFLGAAAGAALGAGAKAMSGVGIREEDIDRIRESVTEGTSALFAVTEDSDLDRLGERVHGLGGVLVATNLTDAERSNLLGVVA